MFTNFHYYFFSLFIKGGRVPKGIVPNSLFSLFFSESFPINTILMLMLMHNSMHHMKLTVSC